MTELTWIFPAELDTPEGLKTLEVRRDRYGTLEFEMSDNVGKTTLGAYSLRKRDWTMKTEYWSLALGLDEIVNAYISEFEEDAV